MLSTEKLTKKTPIKKKNHTSYTEKNFSASRTHSFTGEETIPEMEFNQSKSVNYVFIVLD